MVFLSSNVSEEQSSCWFRAMCEFRNTFVPCSRGCSREQKHESLWNLLLFNGPWHVRLLGELAVSQEASYGWALPNLFSGPLKIYGAGPARACACPLGEVRTLDFLGWAPPWLTVLLSLMGRVEPGDIKYTCLIPHSWVGL